MTSTKVAGKWRAIWNIGVFSTHVKRHQTLINFFGSNTETNKQPNFKQIDHKSKRVAYFGGDSKRKDVFSEIVNTV